MRNRSAAVLNALLVALIFAIAFWTIGGLPGAGQVAIHWGPDNRADAWIGGSAAYLVNPLTALVIWFLFSMLGTFHVRFSSIFLIQLALQLLIAIHALGLLPF
ncbi:hypothetical protein SRABI118_02483 [Massilia sp. Bi118]|uniref:hypothetical protein n=1 Tax=Massilia sp. Bi118 TaxID=2822346 RepID=UPI001D55BE7E|nr:hypothetical protein [Massilia sp. Bi118]CAH0231577.1 hypothetical protein SRABI118_02483 [Massilia sp. Bi118]